MFVLTSCEEPIDGVIEIPEAKLAISSNFYPNELVHVSVSSTFGRNQQAMYIPNAQVNLYSNDDLIESLEFFHPSDPGAAAYYSTREFRPQINHRYTIRVDAPGFDQVVAVSSIPDPVPIRLFELEGITKEAAEGDFDVFALSVNLDYEDPEEVNNYYHLRIYQQYRKFTVNGVGDTVFVDSYLKPVKFPESSEGFYKLVAENNSGILIQDRPHDEYLSFVFRSRFNPALEQLGNLYAQFRTVSKEYYDFEHSISYGNGSSTGGSGINPSVVVQSNVSNGFGVFAGYAFTSDSLRITY